MLASGCTSTDTPAQTSTRTVVPSTAVYELGVETLTIREAPDHLTIVGLDVDGTAIARLELTQGEFAMEEDGRWVNGRRLLIDVLGTPSTHESEGRYQLELPLPMVPANRTLVSDGEVAEALLRFGVGFEVHVDVPDALQPERPYLDCGIQYHFEASSSPYTGCTTCTYSGCAGTCRKYPISGPISGEFRCCSLTKKLGIRRCHTSGAGQATECGTTGSQGCAVCFNESWLIGCNVNGSGGTCTAEACLP